MKIAVWHNLPSGGGKRALYYQIKGLLERGHTIEAWCPPSADQTYLPLRDLLAEHILPCEKIGWVALRGQNALENLLAGYRYQLHKIKALDEHCQKCAEEIEGGGFDLLFANSDMYMRVTSIGRNVTMPKAIYLGEPNRSLYEAMPQLPWVALPPRARDLKKLAFTRKFLRNWFDVQGLRILARDEWLNAHSYDAVLVNSLYTRECLIRVYGMDSQVCYLGVDTELFKPRNVERQNLIVGLGSIHPEKGVERAIRAVGALPASQRPPLIWVANFANPGYQNEMQELAQSLAVRFEPRIQVSDDEVTLWLSRAAFLLYTPFLEPFGFAPLEANACETPVIAIAEGGIRETVKDGVNGYLVSDSDPNELALAMMTLLGNPNKSREMGRVARKYVIEGWSWKTAIDRLEQELVSVLQRPQANQNPAITLSG